MVKIIINMKNMKKMKNEKYKNENWPTVKTPSLSMEIVNQMTKYIILFDILDCGKMKLNP